MKKIGRYEIVGELGRGAMGVVYKASDPTIGRLVAIKVLSLEPTSDDSLPGVRDIFLREARAAGRLSHPGIVTIHDALEDPETKKNYIVMEFVPGRTLENVLLYGPPLTTDQSLDIVRQIAEALDYAHREKIIHRDLKPPNILLTEDGRSKITDFGIAKIVAREGSQRTLAIMGTPSYMSPELVTGGEIDARSDLFSLGIILYLLLGGQKPFVGDTAAVMFKIVYEDPIPPSQMNPKLSFGHDFLALRCLAKDRDKRYGSAREFLDDLDDVVHGRPPRSQAQYPLSELRVGERTVIRTPLTATQPAKEQATVQKASWTAAKILIALAYLTPILVGGVWLYRKVKPSPLPPPQKIINAASQQASPATGTVPPPSSSATAAPPQAVSGGKTTKPASAGRVQNHTKAAKALASQTVQSKTAVEQPLNGSPGAERPIASTAHPSPIAKSAASSASVAGGTIQLVCQHELRSGTISVSSGSQVLFLGPLHGGKKGGFLKIKGSFGGTLSRPVKVPKGVAELMIRVVSSDGSLDLTKSISATPPHGSTTTLDIFVARDHLKAEWRPAPNPKQ